MLLGDYIKTFIREKMLNLNFPITLLHQMGLWGESQLRVYKASLLWVFDNSPACYLDTAIYIQQWIEILPDTLQNEGGNLILLPMEDISDALMDEADGGGCS